ncbi:MAG: PilZ domain-containing protein [Deltaproteobacteria bacterium]|nr:PilZ domain-containing protein [Deltaproteobacteria bacterium]
MKSKEKSEKEKKAEFEPVADSTDIRRMLDEALKTMAPASVWTKNQEQFFTTAIHALDLNTESKSIYVPEGVDPGEFENSLVKNETVECFFNVQLVRSSFFFKADYLGTKNGFFRFRIPEKLFKLQRRGDFRLNVPLLANLRARVPAVGEEKQYALRLIRTISASGLSFLAPTEEKHLYETGTVIEGLAFDVCGKEIVVDAEVRHAKKVTDPLSHVSQLHVGVKFKSLHAKDAHVLAAYVFEESRKMYSRLT